MAKADSIFLDVDGTFPEMELQLVSGENLALPDGFGGGYGVILFYRGHWWPFCRQQLADFQKWLSRFEAEEVRVIAGSVDPIEKAKETVEKAGIKYPVAYGMVAEEVNTITGAFYDRDKKFLHATGFLIRPDNTIDVACYSSGPVGRFVPKDLLGLIKFYKKLKQ